MDVFEALAFIVLGVVLGIAGQAARVVVGLKKSYEKSSEDRSCNSFKEQLDKGRLLTSLLIGAAAGPLGAVLMYGAQINKQTLVALVGIGYAGTDFIEG